MISNSLFETALTAMQKAGATLVDAFFSHFSDIFSGTVEFIVLLFDLKIDVQKYLATRTGVPLAGGTLQDAINFNNANAAQELQFFGQEIFELSESLSTDPNTTQAVGLSYNQVIAADILFGAAEGIDLLLSQTAWMRSLRRPTTHRGQPT